MGNVGKGCGIGLDRWLHPGDVIELEVEGIGILRNRVGEKPSIRRWRGHLKDPKTSGTMGYQGQASTEEGINRNLSPDFGLAFVNHAHPLTIPI